MTEAVPPTGAEGEPTGVPAVGGWTGAVPDRVGGVYYDIGLVILLSIVTLGIWPILWTYHTGEDLKAYNGDGLGGALNAVLWFFINPVVMFLMPNEIEKTYRRDGRESPVSTLLGLWFLLPLIGHIVWYVKVQRALNEFWVSKGSPRD
jgi:hypothetical protein